ncbi:hypothetical protein [Chitinophaga defluvii]|uniref:PRTRC genetic system protein F n=1 Tax=Chitinophaga defluvii TaxID=3163343 RepID=A0ABV2TEM4_9BACT|nr:hypothetical protein [Bacteroidota bacterium]MBS1771262.1 hypothetical protein [Bacteroidota bacterium]
MEYAAQYYIGHHSNATKAKTKETVQTIKRVHSIDTTHKRCTRNRQRQTEVRAGANVANAFLKTTFLPKLEIIKSVQSPMEVEKIETDFYHSLFEVARHYNGFEPLDTRTFGYPYNLALSVWEVENHLKRNVRNWNSLRLVQDDKGKTFFISEEQYCTGATLYYIPVVPLYKMLRNKQERNAALLLLSVFAYLYHIADIPYYRQEDAYIYWQYEMITDWIEQDDETDLDSRKEELKVAKWCGDKIEQKIFNRKSLNVFADRIKAFKPKNDFEHECLNVAKGFFTLYTDYPATSVFQNAKCVEDEAEQEDEVIAMNKYISFIADANGWLYETLAESVNNEFNEYGTTEEPTVVKIFSGENITDCNLDFENRLFPLIDDLCYLLNNH